MDQFEQLSAALLEQLGVSERPERFATILRDYVSAQPMSNFAANITRDKVAERIPDASDREAFVALHASLRSRGEGSVDKVTHLIQKLSEERGLLELLRSSTRAAAEPAAAEAGADAAEGGGAAAGAGGREGAAPTVTWESMGWLLSRAPLSWRHLVGVRPAGREGHPLASLPLAQQARS